MGRLDYKSITKALESLSDIVVKNDLTSITIEDELMELTVTREKRGFQGGVIEDTRIPGKHKPMNKKETVNEISKLKTVPSPRVGFFHLYDPKTNEPFIVIGDKINENQKIGYIQALGQTFSVKSDYSGIVKSILVENEMAVEYDQPLIELEG